MLDTWREESSGEPVAWRGTGPRPTVKSRCAEESSGEPVAWRGTGPRPTVKAQYAEDSSGESVAWRGTGPRPTAKLASAIEDRSLWRYREALPIPDEADLVTLGEGMTPLIPLDAAADSGHYAKLDYLCPTGSYKDRGASVLLTHLKGLGVEEVVEDSSGNAGAAIAAYSARAGIRCTIYCPASTSKGKLAQIAAYGAELKLVEGNRMATTEAVKDAAKNVCYASHNWHPFFLEGTKTLAFEIVEQLGGDVPAHVICPVGFGSIYLGLFIGFRALCEAGVIECVPRLLGVQAAACCPIYNAYRDMEHGEGQALALRDSVRRGEGQALALRNSVRRDEEQTLAPRDSVRRGEGQTLALRDSVRRDEGQAPALWNKGVVSRMRQTSPTLAEGITAELPVRGQMILDAIHYTNGAFTIVDDAEIQAGIETLATRGIYVEPTSAVVVKGYEKFREAGIIGEGETTVSVLTGIGLKAKPINTL